MAGNSSMRAGGIHWAATLDAGGFEKGARQVRAEATRLQKELESIRRNFKDSPFAQRVLSDRARESAIIRESEAMRFQAQTAKSLQTALGDLAKSERMAKAETEGFSAGALSLTDVGVVGAAIVGVDALTKKIAKLGEGLTEIAKASFDGTANMNNLVESFIRSIPIVGNVEKALTGVYDILDVGINGDKSRFGRQAQAERAARAKGGSENILPRLEAERDIAIAEIRGEGRIRRLLWEKDQELTELHKQSFMPGDFDKARKAVSDRFRAQIRNETESMKAGVIDPMNELPAWMYGGDGLTQNIIEYNKALEDEAKRFRELSDAADAMERRQVVIGVNDPMTLHAIEFQKQQKRVADARRDTLIDSAQRLFGAEQNAAGRTFGAVTRGSQAALSLMANRNSDPVTLTAERMKELLEIAKRQLKIEEDAQRAWQEAYGAN